MITHFNVQVSTNATKENSSVGDLTTSGETSTTEQM